MPKRDITTQLLDAAQELVQTHGYNAFSYGDLAERVGIRTASIHYHFPTKGDLGAAILERYRQRFLGALASLDEQFPDSKHARKKLERYVLLFHSTLKAGNRMCLGGMLATEFTALPVAVQREVKRFFDDTEAWLEKTLTEGRRSGALRFEGSPGAAAKALLALLEGAMIVARTFGDDSRLAAAANWLLKNFMNGA
jgi:TetR/AcrR family transcriptional regulator, transcriptional repressor for nem operon